VDRWTYGRTFETYFIRSTRRSRPKHYHVLRIVKYLTGTTPAKFN